MKALVLATLSSLSAIPASAVLNVQFTVWNETCGNSNGAIQANVQGGAAPYTYSWSSGGSDYIETGLAPGWHVLTITDAVSTVLIDSAEVLAVPNLETPYPVQLSQGGLFGCGGCNAGIRLHTDLSAYVNFWGNIVSPITLLDPVPLDMQDDIYVLGPYCETDVPVITITDASGCTGTITLASPIASPGGSPQLVSMEPACLGPNGSITVLPWGPMGGSVDTWMATLYDDSWNVVQVCDWWTCGSPEVTFSGLAAGNYHMVRAESYYDPYGMSCPPETLDVALPSLGPDCGQVMGTVFFDHDQDCVQDANDEAIPYRVMAITPGPEYVMTDASGSFSQNLVFGSYDLDQQAGTELIQLCPATSPIPFTLASLTPVATLDIADSSAIPFDLVVLGAHGPTRLGFDALFSLDVRNLSGALSGPVTLSFTIDPVLSYVEATPTPTTIAGNVLTWDLAALGAFGSHDVNITVNIPPIPALMGTVVTCAASMSNTISEASLVNNSATLSSTITAAYDPNDKTVQTSSGSSAAQYFLDSDEWLDYTIRFQNTGTDTAFTVVLVDSLPAELDPLSFQPGASSHPYHVAMSGDGIVRFTFSNILLPDSNVNETASHGFVGFRIQPRLPLLPGTIISNAADIFFDFNPPVRTNDAVVVAENSTTVDAIAQRADALWIYPNPARDVLLIANSGPGSIELLDPAGRCVIRAAARGELARLHLGDLSPGQYLVRAIGPQGMRWARFTKAE